MDIPLSGKVSGQGHPQIESETEFLPSEWLYLGLGYGALIQKMHHIIATQQMPLALVISGPKGVGKHMLCRVMAAQILKTNTWLRDVAQATTHSVYADNIGPHLDGANHPEHPNHTTTFAQPLDGVSHSRHPAPQNPQHRAHPESQNSESWKKVAAACARWEKDQSLLEAHPEYIMVQKGAGIEDIRRLRQKLSYTRHNQSWRIVILPEAQSLSTNCTNALLKWIESPPPQTCFFLTASSALSKTLASRCVSYTMAPLDEKAFSDVRNCGQRGHQRAHQKFFAPAGQPWEEGSRNPGIQHHNAAETSEMDDGAQKVLPADKGVAPSVQSFGMRTFESKQDFATGVVSSGDTGIVSSGDFDADICLGEERFLFKISQGCLGAALDWKEHIPWVKQGWMLFHRCALGQCLMDEDWLKTALTLGDRLWEMVYIWAREGYGWAYAQGFLWHWDAFWTATWALVTDHQTYHTDLSALLQILCARIYGFFAHYGLPPMPQDWDGAV